MFNWEHFVAYCVCVSLVCAALVWTCAPVVVQYTMEHCAIDGAIFADPCNMTRIVYGCSTGDFIHMPMLGLSFPLSIVAAYELYKLPQNRQVHVLHRQLPWWLVAMTMVLTLGHMIHDAGGAIFFIIVGSTVITAAVAFA